MKLLCRLDGHKRYDIYGDIPALSDPETKLKTGTAYGCARGCDWSIIVRPDGEVIQVRPEVES